jgi:hypothetical protein
VRRLILLLNLQIELLTAHIYVTGRDDPHANLSPLNLFNDDANIITNPDRFARFACECKHKISPDCFRDA